MRNERIAYVLIIIQAVLIENMADSQKKSSLTKLSNHNAETRDETLKKLSEYEQSISEGESKCRHKCLPWPRLNRQRFTNQGTKSSEKNKQMEAPSRKYSFLNMFTDEEEKDDDDDDDNDDDDQNKDEFSNDDKVKEKDEEDEEEEDGMSFFDEEEDEINPNKLKDEDDESLLKQYHRHRLKLHNMVFPLLLAYKLKFFTVIPLLLGTLVLLVGTTGVAGFFFALFAAALGLQVKTSNHHHHH